MRIAVFSDIHGNIYALDAVLEALAHEPPLHAIVAAGDLALGGSDPAGCIDRLRQARALAVYGNTDEYLFAPHKTPGDELHLKKWDRLLAQVHWARPLLGQERIDWLAALPLKITFSPSADPADDLLIFHANPLNIEDMILPAPPTQLELLGNARQTDEDPILARVLERVAPRTLVFGHVHFTSVRLWRGKKLVNVAPCSLPALDKDPRARYTLFEWDGHEWCITRRYIDYDWQQEIKALQASGMPFFEDYTRTFAQS